MPLQRKFPRSISYFRVRVSERDTIRRDAGVNHVFEYRGFSFSRPLLARVRQINSIITVRGVPPCLFQAAPNPEKTVRSGNNIGAGTPLRSKFLIHTLLLKKKTQNQIGNYYIQYRVT
jgi:hypothetical protein